MRETTKRAVNEGIGFGLVAGLIFGVMEVIGAAMMGNPPLMPVRMFASVVLGEEAMMQTPLSTAVPIGLIAHFALSAMFGLVYGLINSRLSAATETSYGRQAVIGLVFGAMLWLVNFQIVARILYPWFLEAPQFLQMAMHAMFFGLPLALMFAAGERHAHHVGRAARVPA
jgi:predicted small integral membrane protein